MTFIIPSLRGALARWFERRRVEYVNLWLTSQDDQWLELAAHLARVSKRSVLRQLATIIVFYLSGVAFGFYLLLTGQLRK